MRYLIFLNRYKQNEKMAMLPERPGLLFILSSISTISATGKSLSIQQILSIPVKKTDQTTRNYLSIAGITLLLQQPDTTTSKGRRDLALLSLM